MSSKDKFQKENIEEGKKRKQKNFVYRTHAAFLGPCRIQPVVLQLQFVYLYITDTIL
jgi:hypothetical protein